jgi:serine/threonine protein kinase
MTVQNLTGHARSMNCANCSVGGMGVAIAFQRNLNDVAVKVLSPALANDPGYIERFYREAKTAASLEHSYRACMIMVCRRHQLCRDALSTGGSLEDHDAARPNRR